LGSVIIVPLGELPTILTPKDLLALDDAHKKTSSISCYALANEELAMSVDQSSAASTTTQEISPLKKLKRQSYTRKSVTR